jgi:hypothetical protein
MFALPNSNSCRSTKNTALTTLLLRELLFDVENGSQGAKLRVGPNLAILESYLCLRILRWTGCKLVKVVCWTLRCWRCVLSWPWPSWVDPVERLHRPDTANFGRILWKPGITTVYRCLQSCALATWSLPKMPPWSILKLWPACSDALNRLTRLLLTSSPRSGSFSAAEFFWNDSISKNNIKPNRVFWIGCRAEVDCRRFGPQQNSRVRCMARLPCNVFSASKLLSLGGLRQVP